jgi:N utilization substance protein B
MSGTRHKARAIALQTLYEIDSVEREPGKVTERFLSESALSEENKAFVLNLVEGVVRNEKEIDLNIRKYAPTWPIEQIALIDRNILRLAIFEILFDNKVPVKVAISEAVELAKSYGSENSARFVNGVLGSISVLANH